jgi:hypothetical protein
MCATSPPSRVGEPSACFSLSLYCSLPRSFSRAAMAAHPSRAPAPLVLAAAGIFLTSPTPSLALLCRSAPRTPSPSPSQLAHRHRKSVAVFCHGRATATYNRPDQGQAWPWIAIARPGSSSPLLPTASPPKSRASPASSPSFARSRKGEGQKLESEAFCWV